MIRFKPSALLLTAAILAGLCTLAVIFGGEAIVFNMSIPFVGSSPFTLGIICLTGISFFMSLMFPTLFGLRSRGLGEATKLGASGLIMAILGEALLKLLQGKLIDVFGGEAVLGSAAAESYVIPLVCVVVIAMYAIAALRTEPKTAS
jgi:FHS family L-fucose permease-like MFS transporter